MTSRSVVAAVLLLVAANGVPQQKARQQDSPQVVTVEEERRLQVALDASRGVYHVKGCPSITPEMPWLQPAAAVLKGYRRAPDCVGRIPTREFRAVAVPLPPKNPQLLKVLFVGNSLTYYNELPWLVEQLASSAGEPRHWQTGAATMSGATLRQLWERGRAVKAIRTDRWDYVVLQEQSSNSIRSFEEMREFARRFDEEIRRAGARTVLFETWAMQDEPSMQSGISTAYARIARELGVLLAPVGTAWEKALSKNRFLRLHDDSRVHPNLAGSYLAACVFYSLLSGRSPERLVHRFPVHYEIPESYRVSLESERLTEADAAFLQRIAWETVRQRSMSAAAATSVSAREDKTARR